MKKPPEGFRPVLDVYGGRYSMPIELRDQDCEFWREEWPKIETFKLSEAGPTFNCAGLWFREREARCS